MTLKDIRKARGYTQEHLSKELNVSLSTIGMYEIGQRKPSIDKVSKLAEILEVSEKEILECFTLNETQ